MVKGGTELFLQHKGTRAGVEELFPNEGNKPVIRQ